MSEVHDAHGPELCSGAGSDANYQVWSRGYGLMDSPKVEAAPGGEVELAPPTATPHDAASIYPASYW